MSWFKVLLRIRGEIEPLEKVAQALEGFPFVLRRRGEMYGRRMQPGNVFFLELAEWERGGIYPGDDKEVILMEEKAQLSNAAKTLQRLIPVLADLDRTRCQPELYISTIREEWDGGFTLPAVLVAAAGSVPLSMAFSIQVAADGDDDQDTQPR